MPSVERFGVCPRLAIEAGLVTGFCSCYRRVLVSWWGAAVEPEAKARRAELEDRRRARLRGAPPCSSAGRLTVTLVSGPRPSVAAAPSSAVSFRSLRIMLPGGLAYWTVVDDGYRVVEVPDGFLRDLRFGADRTESTTKLYSSELALFLDPSSAAHLT
jgi:hypothetical protein